MKVFLVIVCALIGGGFWVATTPDAGTWTRRAALLCVFAGFFLLIMGIAA